MKTFESARVDFSPEQTVFTFSGANGAGKSTIMRAAWLVQKAHFLGLLGDQDAIDAFQVEAKRYLSSGSSQISIVLEVYDESTKKHEQACVSLSMSRGKSILTYDREDLVASVWNLDRPQQIILFIDASKSFSEETLSYHALSIASNDRSSIVLQAILSPENLFSGIYRQLVRDYVHNRLVPSTPDRTLYFNLSKAMFSTLLPNVEIRNFSGNHTSNEFVLLGRTQRAGQKSSSYDVREFSSGEKALFATLTFLSISRSVAILMIDEPENHFHDSLLMEFVALMQQLTAENGILAWVDAYNAAITAEAKSRTLKREWISAEYEGHRLEQIILATHSRSLIYKSFSLGQNIAVAETIRPIEYEKAEQTLRSLGLSTTISRLLLVEGEGDSAALNFFLSGLNAQIMPLNGSDSVVETFRRLSKVHGNLKEFHFVFLVDSDNRPSAYFDDIRAVNPEFFDASFVRLPVHEFENLLLDAPSIAHVAEQYARLHGGTAPTVQEIQNILVALARDAIPQTVAKEMANEIRLQFVQHFGQAVWNNLPNSDMARAVKDRVSSALSVTGLIPFTESIERVAVEIEQRYSGLDEDALLIRCDGKRVFKQACGKIAGAVGVTSKSFEQAVYRRAREVPGAQLLGVLSDIGGRLNSDLSPGAMRLPNAGDGKEA